MLGPAGDSIPKVRDDNKTQRSRNGQYRNGDIDPGIVGKTLKTIVEKSKTGRTKSGHTVEYGKPNGLGTGHSHLVERDKERHSPQCFHDQSEHNHTLDKIIDLNGVGQGEFGANDFLVPMGNALGGEQEVICGEGHIPNAPDLDQQHDHKLSQKIVGIIDADGNQSRGGYGRCGGKKIVQKGYALLVQKWDGK